MRFFHQALQLLLFQLLEETIVPTERITFSKKTWIFIHDQKNIISQT